MLRNFGKVYSKNQGTCRAEEQITEHKKSSTPALNKKIVTILEQLEEHPKTGIGHPEQLKQDLSGYWSRQLDKKNRLIYKIEDEIVTVTIISAMGHYGQK